MRRDSGRSRADQIVVVTGANSGIGRSTAIRLAKQGYSVVGTVRSNNKGLALVKECEELGIEIDTITLDIRDPAAAEMIAARRPYALINNAGYSNFGAVEDVPHESAVDQIETMLLAPMRLSQAVLPGMIHRGGGRIVFVSSIFGFVTVPLNAWYQASKHGLEAAADALRCEVAKRNVQVVVIQPGAVATKLWDDHLGVLERWRTSRHIHAYKRSLEFMRWYARMMTTPERVARAIELSISCGRARRRYLVGSDAWTIALFCAVLPSAARDRLSRRILGL